MSIQLKNEVSELRARLDQVEKILKREFPVIRTVAGKPDVSKDLSNHEAVACTRTEGAEG